MPRFLPSCIVLVVATADADSRKQPVFTAVFEDQVTKGRHGRLLVTDNGHHWLVLSEEPQECDHALPKTDYSVIAVFKDAKRSNVRLVAFNTRRSTGVARGEVTELRITQHRASGHLSASGPVKGARFGGSGTFDVAICPDPLP